MMTPADSASDRDPLTLDRRGFLGRAAAMGLGAVAAGVLRPDATARATTHTSQRRELIVLQWSDLTALDPHAATYMTDCRVSFNLFDTLVRRHPDGTLHPALATAWRRTGPTTWHLTLRQDVRWHDGSRFTAVDAKYSLDRTFDPSVKAARLLPLFQTIGRTETPDAETLVIHTKRPDVLIPARLEHNPWIVVIQPFEDYGLRRYVEFTPSPDQQLELRRFNFQLRRA